MKTTLNFEEQWANAVSAAAQITALEDDLRQKKEAQDAGIKILKEHILPCCNEAIEAFNARPRYGIKIKRRHLGEGIDLVNSERKSINLRVRMFGGNDHEFDEWFDSQAELESITTKVRAILDPIFKAKGIPLTLGKLVVPPSYFTK